jgi:carbonic anhydrase
MKPITLRFTAAVIGIAIVWSAGAVLAAPAARDVDPAAALQELLDGNQRFVAGRMEHPNQTIARRNEVAPAQHPIASVLACSDSRTPPSVLFDRGLGDLFVVRVAGNVASEITIESLDYAVTHLGTRLVMVLGHQRCGAVIAAVEGHEEPGPVGPMLRELAPAVRAAKKMKGDTVANAVRENVLIIVKKLENDPRLAAMVKRGDVQIVGGIYSLDTGKVTLIADSAAAHSEGSR